MTPTCSQPRHDTLGPRLRRVRIAAVFAEPLAHELSDPVIAPLSLPQEGQRKARRQFLTPTQHRDRRRALLDEILRQHPKDLSGAVARGAVNLALWAAVFVVLLFALANWGTP